MKGERARLTVLVLPEHVQAATAMAQERGESVAVVVRGLIREEAQRRGLWPVPAGATGEHRRPGCDAHA